MNKKGDTYNGKQSDVWSCGVMLYVTLVGQYPFERPEDKQDPQKLHKMIRRIVQVDYQLPSRVKVSEGCQVRDIFEFAVYAQDCSTSRYVQRITRDGSWCDRFGQ